MGFPMFSEDWGEPTDPKKIGRAIEKNKCNGCGHIWFGDDAQTCPKCTGYDLLLLDTVNFEWIKQRGVSHGV